MDDKDWIDPICGLIAILIGPWLVGACLWYVLFCFNHIAGWFK
jgi:hypothetical protein